MLDNKDYGSQRVSEKELELLFIKSLNQLELNRATKIYVDSRYKTTKTLSHHHYQNNSHYKEEEKKV